MADGSRRNNTKRQLAARSGQSLHLGLPRHPATPPVATQRNVSCEYSPLGRFDHSILVDLAELRYHEPLFAVDD